MATNMELDRENSIDNLFLTKYSFNYCSQASISAEFSGYVKIGEY